MITEALLATGLVVTGNVAVVAFAARVTVACTCAAPVLLLDNATAAPPAGAGPFKVTVPVAAAPPTSDAGFTLTELSTAAVTVKFALCVAPYVPEMVSEVFEPTGLVVTGNVAVVAFAATVTLAGTCVAPVLLLDRVTTAPPVGAGPFRVTVPVEELPPSAEVGFSVMEVSVSVAKFKPETFPPLMVVF